MATQDKDTISNNTQLPEEKKEPAENEVMESIEDLVEIVEVDLDTMVPDLICEFFEVAIHAVLYYRDLYPPGMFERRQKYEVPVWIASHPALLEYVTNCISGMKPYISNGSIKALMIAIFPPRSRLPIERFIFRRTKEDEKFTDNVGSLAEEDLSNAKAFLFEFGEALKSFMVKISACKSYLKPLPPGCTCSLQILTDFQTQLGMSEQESSASFPWIEVDDKERNLRGNKKMHSIRGPVEGICPLEMCVEETRKKFDLGVKSKVPDAKEK